jgi:hypothetical protein
MNWQAKAVPGLLPMCLLQPMFFSSSVGQCLEAARAGPPGSA